jgi:SHS2 domain-containing protein
VRQPRPTRRWGSFPTTADTGIWATGPTAAALLEALALGLYALGTDVARVRPRETRTVRVTGVDLGGLAVALLSELLTLEETDGFDGRSVTVRLRGRPPTVAEATVRGEPFDPARHRAREAVKAITFHRLVVDPKRGRARVIVDL